MAKQPADRLAEWLFEKIKQNEKYEQEQAVEEIQTAFGSDFLNETPSGKVSIARSVRRRLQRLADGNISWNPGHRAWVYEGSEPPEPKKEADAVEQRPENTTVDLQEAEKKPDDTRQNSESLIPTAVEAQAIPDGAELDHPSLYLNRELGWLDFNWRVLFQAMDKRIPLLERVRFIGITCSNLDEFIQKRVGGLKRQEAAGVSATSPDGRTPSQQIEFVQTKSYEMCNQISNVWHNEIMPELEQEGVKISEYRDLKKKQRKQVDAYFMEHIYPILTPLAVDPGHPFPFISNLSLSMAVILKQPKRNVTHFARVKIPDNQPRWLKVEDKNARYHYVPIEEVVRNNIDRLFRGMEIQNVFLFRVTRNADIRREEEEADDLLDLISEELRERRFAPVVRLEVEQEMTDSVLNFLKGELGLEDLDVYRVNGLMDLTDAFALADLNLKDQKFSRWNPVVPKRLHHEGETNEEENIFQIIKNGDLLVHHPYDSFSASVQRLIEEAADDPKVIAIKQTLYRTSENSPIVKALTRAAEAGKQVAVLVEVKARFDEANNIEWGKMLENAGVHVTYGLVGLKTHAKVALVVREESSGPRTYCHVGTGNYHVKTASIYTDLGLLTCDPDIGYDVTNLFHYLTGYAPEQHYKKLIVAPVEMRDRFYSLIEREIEIQQDSGEGLIIAKMNALDDIGLIKRLYKASQEGVEVNLIIRGHSRLRPGLEHYSENINLISIIGRFLEHDRMFYFGNGGDPDIFIGSADWRNRNLSDRVEAIVPISEKKLKKRLEKMLKAALRDNRLAWQMQSDGSYFQRKPESGAPERNFHEIMMNQALKRAAG